MKTPTSILFTLTAVAVMLTACMHRAAEYDTPTPPPTSEDHRQGIFHYERAHARLAQADYDNAVADIDKARKLIDPQLIHLYIADMHKVYYQSGIAYYDTGLYDQSALLFDKAIDIAPSPSDYPDAYYWRGMSHYREGRYRQAIADFDKVTHMEQDFPDAAHYRRLSQERLLE